MIEVGVGTGLSPEVVPSLTDFIRIRSQQKAQKKWLRRNKASGELSCPK